MNRRIGFIAVLLVVLVVLLGFARGTSRQGARSTAPARETAATPVSTTPAGDREATTGTIDQPRHPDIGFRDSQRLLEHYRKHGREFHARSAPAYLRLAQILRDRPKSGEVLEFVRNDAVTCRFDRNSGAFLAFNSDGTIRTFFRPRTGEKYFERQKSLARERP